MTQRLINSHLIKHKPLLIHKEDMKKIMQGTRNATESGFILMIMEINTMENGWRARGTEEAK